jgi:hypothetical protein
VWQVQYDEHWQDKQERGLTRWVNSIFKDAHYLPEENQPKRSASFSGWSTHRADVLLRYVAHTLTDLHAQTANIGRIC